MKRLLIAIIGTIAALFTPGCAKNEQSVLYGPPPFDPRMEQDLYGVPAIYETMDENEIQEIPYDQE